MSPDHASKPRDEPQGIRKILVATTLGESSDHVVAAGRTLARATRADLYLLHAYTLPAMYYGNPMGMTAVYPQTMESELERVRLRLTAQLQRLEMSPADVAGEVLEVGAPHRLLTSAAKDLDADLILVGASETNGRFAPLLGSTADRILRQSQVPVWVVRGTLELPFERVLAPTDLSELSQESLRHGLSIVDAVAEERPRLETLFVLSNVERTGSVQFSPDQVERFARQELELANCTLAEETGWGAVTSLRTGLPRQEILAEIETSGADLVVIGTHGRSGFERLLMGSVAADVVRHASCNVLVVPPSPARDERVGQEGTATDAKLGDTPVGDAVH